CISCTVDDMATFLEKRSSTYSAIGVDVGGPCFDYDATFDARTCSLLRRRLLDGMIAINVSCDWTDDTPQRIASRLRSEDLEIAICDEVPGTGRNAIVLASDSMLNVDRLHADAKALGFFLQKPA